jgi:hypothetical protein
MVDADIETVLDQRKHIHGYAIRDRLASHGGPRPTTLLDTWQVVVDQYQRPSESNLVDSARVPTNRTVRAMGECVELHQLHRHKLHPPQTSPSHIFDNHHVTKPHPPHHYTGCMSFAGCYCHGPRDRGLVGHHTNSVCVSNAPSPWLRLCL